MRWGQGASRIVQRLRFKFNQGEKKMCKTSPDVPSSICNCLNFALPILVPHAASSGRKSLTSRSPLPSPPLPPPCPFRKRGLGGPSGPALRGGQMLSLFAKLPAKLWLFKVKLVAVKANGCLLYRQVFLKDETILEFFSFLPRRVNRSVTRSVCYKNDILRKRFWMGQYVCVTHLYIVSHLSKAVLRAGFNKRR